MPVVKVTVFTICFSLYLMNAKPQGFKIQDANRNDWIYFQYAIDTRSYALGLGFTGVYQLGMEYHTLYPSKGCRDVYVR